MSHTVEELMEACRKHAKRFGVPEHLTEGIVWYVYRGRPMGAFLTSVFSNNLKEAVFRADPQSLPFLKELVLFIHNELPGKCHGSGLKIMAWRDGGGDPGWIPESIGADL